VEVVKHIENAKTITRLSYRKLCASMEVPYHRFRRWRNRVAGSLPVLTAPGPKKTEAFDPAVLRGEVSGLAHGVHRTSGTGTLYGRYRFALSRRDFCELVTQVRLEMRLKERMNLTRVEWLVPGMVWATDGTEYCEPGAPKGIELLTMREMCSKYLFRPLCTLWTPCGEEISGYLANLFYVNGLPLFVKMDNGGNLCSEAVTETLQEHWVIPLYSPPEYPRYNGSLENAQGDIKGAIQQLLPLGRAATETEFEMCARVAAHDLNHQARRVLKGKTACGVLGGGRNPISITIPERREIYDWLNDTTGSILSQLEDPQKEPSKRAIATARRKAAELWLVKNNIIRLTRNGKSVTLL
jgi:hypothetical protein